MKKLLILLISITLFAACKNLKNADARIKIPAYDNGAENGYSQTYTVKATDLTAEKTIAAKFGCPFAESLPVPFGGNLTEVNKSLKGYKAGDVIAVVDHTELDYERADKQASVNSAKARYSATGAERDRLAWLIESEELARLDDIIEKHTVKAPYDCVTVSFSGVNAGDYAEAGSEICAVARLSEVCAYTDESPELFAVGKAVEISMGSFSYSGTVAACPRSAPPYASAKTRIMTVVKPNEGEIEKIFADTPNALGAGWATLRVTAADKKGVIAVPSAAITSDANESFCVLSGGMRVKVETGVGAGGFTEIRSGLHEGDVVIM